MIDKSKCERVPMAQGAFYLGPSDEKMSVGYLELKPHSSLEIHNRPTAIERLTQVEGKCCTVVFEAAGARPVELKPSDRLIIAPKGTWHIHANPFDQPSLTFWEADGDIRGIIEAIRSSGKHSVRTKE